MACSGSPVLLEDPLDKPEHSLIVQLADVHTGEHCVVDAVAGWLTAEGEVTARVVVPRSRPARRRNH
jgi:hypothetical protein